MFRHFFNIRIGNIRVARRVHPTAFFVETLIDKKLPPSDRPIRVQTFLTRHVNFGTKVKSDVRIDVQNGVAPLSNRGRKRKTIRAREDFFNRFWRLDVARGVTVSVQIFQIRGRQISRIDCPDAAVRPQKRKPRLKMGQ